MRRVPLRRPANVQIAGRVGLQLLAQRKYQVPSATVGVIQALIVVFFVAGDALASRRSPGGVA